ncbi:hypothetical protein OHS70_17005 [Streptomyces sp. NBC_00390]|uniref:hypothetical protein n=1 Tax=Streptomyces sp. NBC_00390 TaxID=2975736 RepID=UPI002E21A025
MAQGWAGARLRAGVAAGAVVLTAGLVGGCSPDGKNAAAQSPAPGSTSSTVSASPSGSPSASASPSPAGSPSATPATPVRTSAVPTRPARPVPATFLSMYATTAGGRLQVPRGGAAQEFTITVRNGNARTYGALVVAFQMEIAISSEGPAAPQNGMVLERRDPATGAWRAVELRVANDALPPSLHKGGAPLAKDAVRTERYRIRATKGGPAVSMPLMITAVDTTAGQGTSYDRAFAARTSLTVSTRQG